MNYFWLLYKGIELIKTFVLWGKNRLKNHEAEVGNTNIIENNVHNNSNTNLEKYRKDKEPPLNHMHKLMSNFLDYPNLAST